MKGLLTLKTIPKDMINEIISLALDFLWSESNLPWEKDGYAILRKFH